MNGRKSTAAGLSDSIGSCLDTLKVRWETLGLDSYLGGRLQQLLASSPALPSASDSDKEIISLPGVLNLIKIAQGTLGLAMSEASQVQQRVGSWGMEFTVVLDSMEASVGGPLRAQIRDQVHGLYVIVDPEVTGGRDPVDIARGALQGGAHMLQLRDKMRDKGQMLPLARELKQLCHNHQALLIINDHADVARLVDADGLHVGQEDLPVAETRRVLHAWQLVGRSNPSPQQAAESEAQGADHVAIGPIYPTGTKATGRLPIGLEPIKQVKRLVSIPVVAIGGINENNVGPVVEMGADAVCVTSAVGLAPDPEEAARRLVERMVNAGVRA